MKLLIVIPYRDRKSHLDIFIPHITNILTQQAISYKIVVVEQNNEHLFNRGLLCNIGFKEFADNYDYVCFHDVDMIGENFDYTYIEMPTHLNARAKNNSYNEWPIRYFGGVVLFPYKDFISVNGFSNEYWGWGAEDDDLRLRCDVAGIKTQRKQCNYYTLPHRLSYQDNPHYKNNKKRIEMFLKSNDRHSILTKDGLNTCEKFYAINSIINKNEYILCKIDTIQGVQITNNEN